MSDKKDLNSMLYDIRRIQEHRVELTDEKIEAIYTQLMDDLRLSLSKVYEQYADSDGRLYLNYLDANRNRAAFLQEIVNNVDSISPSLKKEMETLIDETYQSCYLGMQDSFMSAYSSGKFAGIVSDIQVNPYVLEEALQNNISKLTLPAVMESHRGLITYEIMQELNIGLMNGDRYEKMTKRIQERTGVSASKAKRIVRTEAHRNTEAGFFDCADNINSKIDGSGLVYCKTYRNMQDERVRPQIRKKTKKGWVTTYSKNGANHMNMEGVTIPVNERFRYSDGSKCMYPGSMELPPRHCCNCRCTVEYNLLTNEEYEAIKKNGGKMR